jgi:hypothetical protein
MSRSTKCSCAKCTLQQTLIILLGKVLLHSANLQSPSQILWSDPIRLVLGFLSRRLRFLRTFKMRYYTAFWLLAVAVECIPQAKPPVSLGPSEWPLSATKQVQPQYRSTAKRSVLSYGPIKLYGLDVSYFRVSCFRGQCTIDRLNRKKSPGVRYLRWTKKASLA